MITIKEKRAINKAARLKDDSNLYPIFGQFNVTERAIRQARFIARCNGEFSSAYEYELCLENLMSTIVNDPKNQ